MERRPSPVRIVSLGLALGAGLALLRPLPSPGQAPPGPVPTSPQARSDGDLVAAIHAVNDAEIESGNAALAAAKSEDVKAFARRMVDDHTVSNAKIDRWLAAESGVTSAEGPMTRTFRAGAARDKQQLAGKTGADFERAYVAQQIEAHQATLAVIDSEGRGASQSLTGLLEDARNMAAGHLEHARTLQARIK